MRQRRADQVLGGLESRARVLGFKTSSCGQRVLPGGPPRGAGALGERSPQPGDLGLPSCVTELTPVPHVGPILQHAHQALGMRGGRACPESAALLYLHFWPPWEHISDFITDVSKKMDLVIQNTLQMSSAGTALGSRPHGSTGREAKSKRENAGQLSQEPAAGADPTQGRLLGHLGRPSWGLLSCYLSLFR